VARASLRHECCPETSSWPQRSKGGLGLVDRHAWMERAETVENSNRVECDVWKVKRSRLHTRFLPLDAGVTVY